MLEILENPLFMASPTTTIWKTINLMVSFMVELSPMFIDIVVEFSTQVEIYVAT